MKNNFPYILATMFVMLGVSCGDADVNDPLGSKSQPAQVTNIQVRNISGASVITYDRPDDKNLKYVQAVYTAEDGADRMFNASYYTDSILINGFAKAGEYDVRVYSVSYGETKSEPVHVKVNPTSPAYLAILDKSEIKATFGGFRFVSVDEAASDLSIIFLKKINDDWQEIGAYYTKKAKDLLYTMRGQNSEETVYGAYANDRWGHRSDTLIFTLTPWHEVELPKSKFRVVNLPTDNYTLHNWTGSANSVESLWDGVTNTDRCFHSKTTDELPQWFTFDLGSEYMMSRLLVHWRTNAAKTDTRFYFNTGMPKEFEIWACNKLDPAGSWDSWTKVSDFVAYRADGSEVNQTQSSLTAADKDLLYTGHNFDFPTGIPKYRYIRFKTNSTYGGLHSVMLCELTFFGQ